MSQSRDATSGLAGGYASAKCMSVEALNKSFGRRTLGRDAQISKWLGRASRGLAVFMKNNARRTCCGSGNRARDSVYGGLKRLTDIERKRWLLRPRSDRDPSGERHASYQNDESKDGADNAQLRFGKPLHRALTLERVAKII